LTAPNVTTVNSPITNNVNASTQAILFNVTIKDNVYLVNASVYTNASGLWVRNATNSSLNQLYNNTQILVLVTNLPQNNRSVWNLEACDNAGHCSQYNANQTFIIDLAAPNVTQRNNANPFTSNGATVIFNTTISDNVYLSNASVFFDYAGIWQRQAANTSLSANYNNTPIIVSVSNVPNGNYLWNMEACDAAGNCAFYNANSTFTVTTSSGSTGGVTAPPSSPAPSPKPVDLGTIKYAPPYFVFDAPYGLQKTLELNVQNNKESSVTLSFASLTNLVKVPETIVIPAKSSRTINFKFTAPYQSGTVEDAILVQTDEGAQRRLAVVANIRPYSLKDLGTISFWDNMLKTRIAYLPNAAYVIALLLIAALAIGGDSFASIAARIGFLIIAVVMAYAYYPLIFGA
jgi:hypothetical protein